MAPANAERRPTLKSDERHHCRSDGVFGVVSQISERQPSDVVGIFELARSLEVDLEDVCP